MALFFLQYCDSKSYCEDFTEGKFSFPVIHAIKSQPDDQQLISILFLNKNVIAGSNMFN